MEWNEEVAREEEKDTLLRKKADRRIRNTLAAQRSRQRKVDKLASLEQDLDKAKEHLNAIHEKLSRLDEYLKERGIDLEQFVSQPWKFSVVSNAHFASLAGNTAARTSPQLDPAQLSDLSAPSSYSAGPGQHHLNQGPMDNRAYQMGSAVNSQDASNDFEGEGNHQRIAASYDLEGDQLFSSSQSHDILDQRIEDPSFQYPAGFVAASGQHQTNLPPNDISGYNSEAYAHGLSNPGPKGLGDSDLFSTASLGYDATPTHASLQAAVDPSTHLLTEGGANDPFLKETDRFFDSPDNRGAEPLVRRQSAAELPSPVREQPASFPVQEDLITQIEKFYANLDNEGTFSGEQASTTETGGTSIKRAGSPLQRTPGTPKIQRLGVSPERSDEDHLLHPETSVKDPVHSWKLRGLSARPGGREGR